MKLIHAHVFNPALPSLFVKHKKTDPAEYHTVACSASERCALFAQGQCVARQFMGGGCPFGRSQIQRGPSRMSKSFHTWITEHRKEAEQIGSLINPPIRVARVVDLIWLPYSYMHLALETLTGKRRTFIADAEFTADLIVRLCEARPQAMFGGEIREYQRESVPLFVAHLSESFPDLLADAAKTSLGIQRILATLTKVGRKAKLSTLQPNVGAFEGGWTWDGTHMIATERSAFPPFTKFEAREIRILPGVDAVVTVTDNAQVSPETVFVD